MEVKTIKISSLNPAPYNPRKMSDDEMAKLVNSIAEFGFIDPVIVNEYPGRENVIVGGHQRVLAAKRLGFTEVPVVYVRMDEEKEKLLNLALNKISGQWDDRKLAEVLLGLDRSDVDTLLSGFNTDEIDQLLRTFGKEENFDFEKEAAEIKTPDSIEGEVYQLGPHRLICGDSTKPEDLKKLFVDDKAKLCFTSPPYNMGNKQLYADYEDNLASQEYINFNLAAVSTLEQFIKGFIFWNMSYNKNSRSEWLEVFNRIIKDTGFRFLEFIVWDKGHGLPVSAKDALTRSCEFVLVGENQDEPKDIDYIFLGSNEKKVIFNKKSQRKLTNYWYFSTQNTQIPGHGACFPIGLPMRAIEVMTDRGDIVLDPFGGSGSTLIAAEKTGRVSYLVEKSPLFCDIIRRRYEKFIG